MIPIGKQMAEALLEESDESTLSLSDHESIEGEAAVSSGYPNPKAKPFMSFHVDRGYNGGVTMPTITGTALELEKWFSSLRNVSQSPHMSALLLKNDRIMNGACHHVALDCESEYKAYSRHCVLTIDLWDSPGTCLCTVVGVGPGGSRSVLARVAIVDFFGRCLLDEFVRVEERVTDYRHHITGISETDLSPPKAISYGECRRAVIGIIRGKILVGHALQNDLQVLGIHHPWRFVRDTATYHKFMKRDRYGRAVSSRLRDLAEIHLQIEIQRPGCPHCPLEDACATMALYRKSQVSWDFEAEFSIPPELRYPTIASHGPRIYN